MSSNPPLPTILPQGLPWAGVAGSAPPPPAIDLSLLTATIGGQVVNIVHGTVTGDNAVAQRSQLSFQVYDESGAFAFLEGQPVVLMDANHNTLMKRWVSDAQRGPRYSQDGLLLHTITCVDNHYLADKRLAPYTATNRLAGDIFRDLVTQFLADEGVVVTAVDNGPVIGSFISNYAQVSACFDALCQKAQGAGGASFTWWIDDNREAYFVASSPIPAPVPITDALMERDTEVVTHGNPQYRNTQYMLGGTAETSTQTETFPGDGQTTSFTVGYALSQAPTITVDGAAQTVGIKQVDTGKQWYWAKGDNTIAQDSSGAALATTDTLQIVYVGQYPSVAISQDSSGIAGRASREGGTTSGIVEAAATDTTLSTTTDAFAEAAGYLARYSQDSLTLTFVTIQAGFAQGQLATANVPAYQLANTPMLIESVTLSDIGPANAEVGTLYYTVKAVVGPLNTSWVQFYGALAGQTQAFVDSINLGASGNVAILADGAVAFSWTVTGSATVITYSDPSASSFPSPTTYPGTAGAPVSITWTKTNLGLNALRDALTGAAAAPKLDGLTGYFAWGTGTQGTPATATGLATEAGRKAITSNVNGASVGEDLIIGLLGPTNGVGVAVTEVAFFANASATAGSGTMMLYGLYSHTHTANESVQVVVDSTLS